MSLNFDIDILEEKGSQPPSSPTRSKVGGLEDTLHGPLVIKHDIYRFLVHLPSPPDIEIYFL